MENDIKKSQIYRKMRAFLGSKYQKSDEIILCLFCENFEHYSRMQAQIEKDGLMVEITNKGGGRYMTKHPLTIELTKTAKLLSDLLKLLGLTPSQRKGAASPQLSAADQRAEEKLLKLLNGGK